MDINSIKNYVKTITASTALLFGTAITTNEGLPPPNKNGNYEPYYDSVQIKTICYGYVPVKGEIVKKEYTQKECDIILAKTIEQYSVVLKGLPPISTSATIGFLDFGYNAGIAAANSSTLKKCLMKKDYDCAANAVLSWRFVSKTKITNKDKQQGEWEFRKTTGKYYYDCSQLVNGKPNKVCYGLFQRRKQESYLLGHPNLTDNQIQDVIKNFKY